eukprot:scpid41976/ scgid14504/ 
MSRLVHRCCISQVRAYAHAHLAASSHQGVSARTKHYASMEASPAKQFEVSHTNLKSLADRVRGSGSRVDSDGKEIADAFRTLVDVQSRFRKARSQAPSSPEWDIAVLQDIVNSMATSKLLAMHAPAIHSVFRFASQEPKLDVSGLIESIDADLYVIGKKVQANQLYHLVVGLSYVHSMRYARLILEEMFGWFQQRMTSMSPHHAVLTMQAFSASNLRIDVGSVERLGLFLNEHGLSKIRAQTLAAFAKLLLKLHMEKSCPIDFATEIVARAGDGAETLLTFHDFLHVLLVARMSDQLTPEVLEAVRRFFLPNSNVNQHLQLIRFLFFATSNPHVEALAVETIKRIIPHLEKITAFECCSLVRQISKWDYSDNESLYTILRRAASGSPVTTESLVDLLYGLKVAKLPAVRDVKACLVTLVENNAIEVADLNPRLAVLLAVACAHFNIGAEQWLDSLSAYLEAHLADMVKYDPSSLVIVLDALVHLSYPIPDSICGQLPNVVSGEQLVTDGVRMLRSIWLGGDMSIFSRLCDIYRLSEPSRFATVQLKSVYPAVDYQQITSGNHAFNQSLPKLPDETVLSLASRVRGSCCKKRWMKTYVNDVVLALGIDYVQTLVVSQYGNVCDIALLLDEFGELAPWQPGYVSKVEDLPVVRVHALPPGTVPVSVCIAPAAELCIGTLDTTRRNARTPSRAKALHMEGWRSIVIDVYSARAGVDFLLTSLKADSQ